MWKAIATAQVLSLLIIQAAAQPMGAPGIEWQRAFGGSQNETLTSLQQTADGGFILGGYSYSSDDGNKTTTNFGGADFWVLRLDANGNKLWEESFGGDDDDFLYSLQQTADGGYILGGSSTSGVNGNKTSPLIGLTDYWVVRLDPNGNKIWDLSFGGTNDDFLTGLQQTQDGGFILGGSSASGANGGKTSPNFGGYDFWVVRLDAS